MEQKQATTADTYKKQLRATIIVTIVFVVFATLLGSCVYFYSTNTAASMDRAWRNTQREDIPQIARDFELSRERFDILRSGEFLANGGSVIWGRVNYEGAPRELRVDELYTIEWLPPEELDAILFLLRSEELERNFISIEAKSATIHWYGGGGVSRGIRILYPGVNPQRLHHRPWVDSYELYTSDLGYGYTLQIYTARGTGGMGAALASIAQLIMLVIIIGLAIGTIAAFVCLRSEYIKLRQIKARQDGSQI